LEERGKQQKNNWNNKNINSILLTKQNYGDFNYGDFKNYGDFNYGDFKNYGDFNYGDFKNYGDFNLR
jgi:hypothetical protein